MTSFARLSLRQLQLIAALDDHGSLKRAAEVIGMSQPRATKALQEAEAVIGVKLFHRSNRGLSATPEGTSAIRSAKSIFAQLAAMERDIKGAATGSGQHLRIGTIMGAVPYVIETLRHHLHLYPHSSVEIHEDTSAELLRLLDRGQLDVAIGRHAVSAVPDAYHAQVFHDEVLKVVTHPAHPLAGHRRVELSDLQSARWIVYTAAMPMRLSLEQEFRLAGLPFPAALIETRSALTTLSFIQSDPGSVALLSGDVATFFTNFGMAVTLPVHLRTKSDPYEVITRPAQDVPDHVQQFVDRLIAGARPV